MAENDPAKPMVRTDSLNAIRDLKLPRPKMGTYLSSLYKPATAGEAKLLRDLREAAKGNIAGFNRIMMFKRLSSSGSAFLATLHRHRLRNLVAIYALDNDLPVPVGSVSNALWPVEIDTDGDDLDDDGTLLRQPEIGPELAYARLEETQPKGVRWAPPDAFLDGFRTDLVHDAELISELLKLFGTWQPAADGKMNTLEELITEQHPNEKILVFTEAADTANYVTEELRRRHIEGVALVTGHSENPTRIAQRFSPISNRSQPEELAVAVAVAGALWSGNPDQVAIKPSPPGYILAVHVAPGATNPGPIGLELALQSHEIAPGISDVVADRAYTNKRQSFVRPLHQMGINVTMDYTSTEINNPHFIEVGTNGQRLLNSTGMLLPPWMPERSHPMTPNPKT